MKVWETITGNEVVGWSQKTMDGWYVEWLSPRGWTGWIVGGRDTLDVG